jgi:precorrin-6B C5,15-methyltransferase / cobalt-precorrin-6B C5,C15-methyltransferase
MNHQYIKLDPPGWQPPVIVVAGAGMGRQDLSLRSLSFIERAQVLVGGGRHLEDFAEHPGQKIYLKSPLDQTLKEIEKISRSRRTLVLASGDPLLFGIGRRLANLLGTERLFVLPNFSTVQYLLARLVEPLEEVKVLSLHGRKDLAEDRGWLREIGRSEKVALYTDPHFTPAKVAKMLLECGAPDRRVIVGEDLGLPAERIQTLTLREVKEKEFSSLNLMLIYPEEDAGGASDSNDLAIFGLSDDSFQHQAGLITKKEVRAVVLANLQLKAGLVLWDLGAGSGSVSIEAARVAHLRQVFAVEKNRERYIDLVRNTARFGRGQIQTICGDAGIILQQLPEPDRVFIGGAGTGLMNILQGASQRLRPGGRIVQSIVTLDSLHAACEFWQGKPYELSIAQVQVNRSTPILHTFRLEALNPVFIVTAENKG